MFNGDPQDFILKTYLLHEILSLKKRIISQKVLLLLAFLPKFPIN